MYPLNNKQIPLHVHVHPDSKATCCPSNVTTQKKKKTERKKPTVCIIHPVSIKPGLQPHIFDNNLCSFINSSWSSCTGVNTSKNSDSLCSFSLVTCLQMAQIHNFNGRTRFLLIESRIQVRLHKVGAGILKGEIFNIICKWLKTTMTKCFKTIFVAVRGWFLLSYLVPTSCFTRSYTTC